MATRSTEAKVDDDADPSNDAGRAVGRSGELYIPEHLHAGVDRIDGLHL